MTIYIVRPSVRIYRYADDAFHDYLDYVALPGDWAGGDGDLSTTWVPPLPLGTSTGDYVDVIYGRYGTVFLKPENIEEFWRDESDAGDYESLGDYTGGTNLPTSDVLADPTTQLSLHIVFSCDDGATFGTQSIGEEWGFTPDRLDGVHDHTEAVWTRDDDDFAAGIYGVQSLGAIGTEVVLPAWQEPLPGDATGLAEVPYVSDELTAFELSHTFTYSFEIENFGQHFSFEYEPSDSAITDPPIPSDHVKFQLWIIPGDAAAGVVDLTTIAVDQTDVFSTLPGQSVRLDSSGLDLGTYTVVVTMTLSTPHTVDDPSSFGMAQIAANRTDSVRVHDWWVEIVTVDIPVIVSAPGEVRRRFF